MNNTKENIGKSLGLILIALSVICFLLTSCKVNDIAPNRIIKCEKTGIIEVLPKSKK